MGRVNRFINDEWRDEQINGWRIGKWLGCSGHTNGGVSWWVN
jgi:hypothetical protein